MQLANHIRTRCSDGVARPRCYVARAVDEERHPLERSVPHGGVVRAEIEPWRFEGIGELGVLVVARVFEPVGETKPTGDHFRVTDTGIRCVKAPCFSLRASRLNRESRTTLSGVAVDAAGLTAAELRRALAGLGGSSGLLARGRVVQTADGGRELRATRVFLREPPTRA